MSWLPSMPAHFSLTSSSQNHGKRVRATDLSNLHKMSRQTGVLYAAIKYDRLS